jgi:hypothetical protein
VKTVTGKRKQKVGQRAKAKPSPETVLVLRTCNADMTAHGGFKWPESGHVAAPDWLPTRE